MAGKIIKAFRLGRRFMFPAVKASEAATGLVDLGMAAKARPAVVLNIPFLDDERALYAIVPHTTAMRGGRFEVIIDAPWQDSRRVTENLRSA